IRRHRVLYSISSIKPQNGQLHWERPSAKPTSDLPYWYQAPSAEVELTAYMLMTGLSGPEKDLGRASEIVNWLSKQQNPYGGFSSTQDTVVALQSLGQYAGATFSDAGDVTVTVRSQTGVQEFHVDNTNRLLIQKASLPDIPGDYTLTASGSGCVYVQTVLRYNVPPSQIFELTMFESNLEQIRTSSPSLDVMSLPSVYCMSRPGRYTGSREKSNMALIEVKMLSGFIPVKSSVKELEKSRRIQRGDVQTDMVTLYLDEVGGGFTQLVFEVEQDFDVKNLKPAAVKIYDYYETDMCIRFSTKTV
uniref:Alpha-macroglobulin receptor-binding domain-containing protein n=1 Tax=Leptobrachium leishanense TaxID=445787 RepID=A0A8C5PR31_9ANUR